MTYASVRDIEARTKRKFSGDSAVLVSALLRDAAVMIDAYRKGAPAGAKHLVSCRMVIRAVGDEEPSMFPIGASQGSMGAGGYTQSWTLGSGGATGELYLGKADKILLGGGNSIGARSPLEDMTHD